LLVQVGRIFVSFVTPAISFPISHPFQVKWYIGNLEHKKAHMAHPLPKRFANGRSSC